MQHAGDLCARIVISIDYSTSARSQVHAEVILNI
jgi:hypothetical protein